MPDPRPNHLTWRLLLLASLVGVAIVVLIGRLAVIQILDHESYAQQAAATHAGIAELPAPRGNILDSTGFPLATSEDTWDVYIDRFLWRDHAKAEEAALGLATALGRDPQELLTKGTEFDTGDAVVQRLLPYETGIQLKEQELWGIRLLPSSKRIYPEGGLGGSIIGYVGLDGSGLWGIESDFDGILKGKPGLIGSERDALGRPISFSGRTEKQPEAGGDMTLTIDRFMQSIAEQRLREAVLQYNARGGSILVMDPFTGAVLAMASYPSIGQSGIDLNDPKLNDEVRNRAITDMYEPGSVIKTLTTAAAIDLGRVTPESTYVDTGEVVVEGEDVIRNWDFSANGPTTVREYLQKSLNTGSVWLSQLLGAGDFYRYLEAFGLGDPTHLGLSGEAEGAIRQPSDPDWYPIDLATNSYGQGFAATPIQVLTAVNTFANGGRLMRPYIVSQITNGKEVRAFEPVEVRRPISEATADTMAQMMRDVVEGVEYHGARVAGYDVAGKTGTTLVSIPTGYDLDSTIASFAGFLPYEQPRVSILIKIDQPSGGLNLGGQVAAPVFANVASDIMKYLSVPATQPGELQVAAP